MLHSRASEIAETNSIAPGEALDEGDELVVPVATAASVHPQRYTVRRGDTLITVADRFGVSVEELRRWQHLSSNAIAPGRAITVAEPVKLAPGMRVRGKSSRSKGVKRVAATSSSSHAKTTNVSTKKSKTKPSSGGHAKPTSTKSKSSSSKSKSKAAR